MKLIIFFLILLVLPGIYAASIAVSPDKISFSSIGQSRTFRIYNPNAVPVSFQIDASENIEVNQTTGDIAANSNILIGAKLIKKIENEYILAIFKGNANGGVGVLPAIGIKATYNKKMQIFSWKNLIVVGIILGIATLLSFSNKFKDFLGPEQI